MGVNKVEYGATVLIDLTSDTVTADKLAKGITAHNAKGEQITGTHECSGGGGSSDNNCEAYHITDKAAVISFAGSGTIKVWGYGYAQTQSSWMTTTTIYAFVGDGYYKPSSYGTSAPTKTSCTFSINADGTLSGLPSDLKGCDLLVEIGV